MKQILTYLNFDGNCREAMQFYKQCLGGELQLAPFAEMPGDVPTEATDRIMHARLTTGTETLMASDIPPGAPFRQGNNFAICLQPENISETERIFKALGGKGQVTMPLQDTFWGARFGMLTDQFGINWMINFEKPKE
jgi:PhnB protein